MIGKQLKDLVSQIPDEANVVIDGADFGGYDATHCGMAYLLKHDDKWSLEGFDNDNYTFERRWSDVRSDTAFVASTPEERKQD
jgi:hypothetical protein